MPYRGGCRLCWQLRAFPFTLSWNAKESDADPYRGLRAECAARNVALRDSVQSCLESLADLLTEDSPERLRNEIARFFAYLHCGNDSFNSLPHDERQQFDAIMIGIPPRRLFELLNDMGRVIEGISLIDMSASCIRSAFAENALPYRPNEVFSLLDQFSQIVLVPERDNTLVTAQQPRDGNPHASWLGIRETAKALNINPGVIDRLVKNEHLRDNGKKGTERKIDPESLIGYCKKNNLELNFDPNPD